MGAAGRGGRPSPGHHLTQLGVTGDALRDQEITWKALPVSSGLGRAVWDS